MRSRSTARAVGIALGGVLALGAGLGWLVWGHPAPAPAEAPPVAAAPPVLASVDPALRRRVTLRIERAAPEIPGLPTPVALASATANDYRERARFPHWSHPIRDGVDPILRDRQVTPGHSMGPDGENPQLVVEPERVSFERPDPVVLHARLEQDGALVTPREIHAEIRTEDRQVTATVEFRDDGRDGDAEAGDRVYTARLAPGRHGVPELKGAYLVNVDATTPKGEPRNAVTGFLYSVPKAHLTGRFRDSLRAGNLVIEAEVEVAEAGRFHLEATLGAGADTPIAWAQTAAPLRPGRAWLELTFYGLAVRESGRDGPYVLRSLALSTTGEMPNQKNAVMRSAYTTQAYRASDFRADPFQDPSMLEAAERLGSDSGLDPSRLEVGAP